MDNSPDLFAALEAAAREIQEIEQQRRALDAREEAARRIAQNALEGTAGATGAPSAKRVRSRAGLQQKVAETHLNAITEYLAKQQRARQADIGKALELNSGVPSRAMRELEEAGTVRRVGKEAGSVVWELVPTPKKQRRATDRTPAGSRS